METIRNVEKSYTDPETGKFIIGNPGGGRPKGAFSLKTLIVKKLEEHPELREKIISDLFDNEQALILQMIDGRPKQAMGISIKELPIPIIALESTKKELD